MTDSSDLPVIDMSKESQGSQALGWLGDWSHGAIGILSRANISGDSKYDTEQDNKILTAVSHILHDEYSNRVLGKFSGFYYLICWCLCRQLVHLLSASSSSAPKSFRPQCLVLTGPPNQRPALVDFVGSFTKHISLMICGDIIMEQDRQTRTQETTEWLVKWMNKRRVRSFYTPFTADSLRAGTRHLLQASGLGKLKPNTLVMGFKTNWKDSSPESIEDYVNTIDDTFDSNHCLCILRMMDGLDVFDQFDSEVNQGFEPDKPVENDDQQSPERVSVDDISTKGDSDQIKTVFQNDQGKKTIDVYWIADDGGLTLLVPYLLTRRKNWRSSKVRVFIVGDEQNMEEGRNEMIALLKRFRLDFNDVIVMTDSEKRPHAKSLSRFLDSVTPFRLFDEQQEGVSLEELRQSAPWKISDKEFEAFKLKSERIVRLNEIIRRNSQQTALVLVSLPVPESDCPSALYMAWLDTLTCGLHCPAVLIRGNQQNVLTFYCQ
ncbi:solute carrier family 12 member 3-like protein [Lates japonicus]|uniref:Solute carrier family 12 member 3-like protein n=1 Tax=Lates japonicus TaxID=270547 RepID=A0AAD3MLS3_LATJO|nr:solute carrier family 12 member 3-like protein [Lates japonicus]